MTRSYVFHPAAEADLREIARYSRKQWGGAQTRAYTAKLKHCTETLAQGGGVYQDMSVIHPNLRMVHCEHHYIFCVPRQDASALVIAILHERMDIITRLKLRLIA